MTMKHWRTALLAMATIFIYLVGDSYGSWCQASQLPHSNTSSKFPGPSETHFTVAQPPNNPRNEQRIAVLVPVVEIEPFHRFQDSKKFTVLEWPRSRLREDLQDTITSFDQLKGKTARQYKLRANEPIYKNDISEEVSPTELISELRKGGYILFIRHPKTNPDQADTDPLHLENFKAQRQLSDEGRQQAREMGEAIRALKIPILKVISSKFYRAQEAAKLLDVGEITTTTDVTEGGLVVSPRENQRRARALRELLSTPIAENKNIIIISHKQNLEDAAGKEFGDLVEAEVVVVKPLGDGTFKVVTRIPLPETWSKWAEETYKAVRISFWDRLRTDYGKPAAQFDAANVGALAGKYLNQKITIKGEITSVDVSNPKKCLVHMNPGITFDFVEMNRAAESCKVGETIFIDGILKKHSANGEILLAPAFTRDPSAPFVPQKP